MKIKLLAPLFFVFFGFLNAQDVEFSGSFSTKGLFYSEDESPFWMHSNQRGRVDELSNFSGWINGQAKYQIGENAGLELGLGGLYQDGYTDKLQLDESYLAFQNSWLSIVAGRKQRAELYNGLSASNQNILWSLNARPLPGVQISTTRPIFFKNNKGIGFKASLEEYLMDDERYVDNTRLHHKSFHLVYKGSENFQITAGLQHFVQWAGTSPDFGKLPGSFSDYISVITGKEGDDTVGGQEANALGNHLGSYEVYIDTRIANYNVQFIYNHLFEDGSGRVLRNTPDGRYGVYIEDPNPGKWIDAFIYEFYYTKDQSDTDITTDGQDNYFNNNLYRSGWTYESRILGVPFITLDENRFRVNNNKIVAHHIGISGIAFEKLPYRLLSSYRRNYGGKGTSSNKNTILSTYLDLKVWQNLLDVNIQLGADMISDSSTNLGIGLQISKSFF